jgi:hypothetical protein
MADSSENQLQKSIMKELNYFCKPIWINQLSLHSELSSRYSSTRSRSKNWKLPVKYLNVNRLGEDGMSIEALIMTIIYTKRRDFFKLSIKNDQQLIIRGWISKLYLEIRKVFKIKGIFFGDNLLWYQSKSKT